MPFLPHKTAPQRHLPPKASVKPLNANPTKWSNTLKQFVGKLPTNFLSVFDHIMGLALKGLKGCHFKPTLISQHMPMAVKNL